MLVSPQKKTDWLVVSTHLKNISQLGLLFPIYGKIKMFQTTNQMTCLKQVHTKIVVLPTNMVMCIYIYRLSEQQLLKHVGLRFPTKTGDSGARLVHSILKHMSSSENRGTQHHLM